MKKMKKRADGRYLIQVQIGWQPNGKKKFVNVYGKTISEVEKKAAEIRARRDVGMVISPETITTEQWAAQWLATYKSSLSNSTQTMYRSAIKNHIVPVIGSFQLRKVRQQTLQSMLGDMAAKGYSKRMVSIVRLAMVQIFESAKENRLIALSPAVGLKASGTEAKARDALSIKQQEHLISSIGDDKLGMLAKTLYYLGLRRGEVLALTKADIDLSASEVTINKSAEYPGNQPEIKQPKTKAGVRRVPIPEIFMPELRAYLRTQSAFVLFPGKSGGTMTLSEFVCLWRRAKKRVASIDSPLASSLTPHMLRHTYATALYDLGVDAKTAQKWLGHADIMVTLRIYTHLSQQREERSAATLKNWGLQNSN